MAEEIGDRRIVLRGAQEDLHGKLFAKAFGRVAMVGFHFLDHAGVICGVNDHRDMRMVFCGAAQHRGSTDVDVFDRVLHAHIRIGDGLFEGVKIHDD